jgi:hypothetical protein
MERYSGVRDNFVKTLRDGRKSSYFLTSLIVSILLSLIIITTSSIGIKEFEDLPQDEKLQHSSGYTAQVVFLVIAILVVLLMIAFIGIAYSNPPAAAAPALQLS